MAQLEPTRLVKCTYQDCAQSFPTLKSMKSHKKHSEHDYCDKCDEDFDSYDDLAQHKAFRPDMHNKACRVCGEEFKSTSGLRRHIEMNHRIDQKLPCIGCEQSFDRASLMVEHLEFGHCNVITSDQFMGHIVHKHLVTELLNGGPSYDRFMQKISKFEGTQDFDEEGGGVSVTTDLFESNGTEDARAVPFEAIKPKIEHEDVVDPGPYPPLPSLTAGLASLSMNSTDENTHRGWLPKASEHLFPDACPSPPPSVFSIDRHDEQMNKDHGINILKTRFWDPLSGDWNPERFFNSIISKYFCPFPCEQVFDKVGDMNNHILTTHRIKRMKCPSCLKYFNTVTALMCHCESRGSRCTINKAYDFNIFLDKITGGFLSVDEKTRPDHLHNPTVWIRNMENKEIEQYTPPTASYLQYTSSKPVDWKEPKKVAAQIGRGDAFEYNGQLSKW
ncbi:hypothetical protein P280DRAFT_466555 [Massarina eburnea CBS 473.64]|uniref:C2H2-type domain-containing protein n=1 Tax=Massarina eburnea CBS 473.64 TaxID=1395130 RepID=A0A6A6S7V6_9PLEO|nr:hypothetical protein P280DRAFT_466555 [Massarina eburnea CBS 473.64]